jgi:lipopolysaccharide export system permease protein
MKKTINKYFFYEFLRIFSITLFALSVIVWTVQLVNYLDLVTENGHAFTVYFLYSFLTLSKVMTKLIPLSFLISTVFTIIKFEKDNELIALWSSGLNKIHLVNIIIRISLLVMLIQIFLTTTVNPNLLNLSRSILKNSQLHFIPSLFKERTFNDTVKGLTIFIDKRKENNNYENILIRDEGGNLASIADTSTIFAKTGYITEDEETLILFNGNIQKTNALGEVNIVKFDRTSFNLSGLSSNTISEPKIQETSTLKIIECSQEKSLNLKNCSSDPKNQMEIKIEINKRFGIPTFIPIMGLVCCFLLSSRRDQTLYKFNGWIYSFLGFVIYAAAEMSVRYSGYSWDHSIIYYLSPLIIGLFFYWSLIKKFKYENLHL